MRANRKQPAGPGVRRRDVLKSAAGAAGLLAAPSIVRGINLNEKLNVAVVGCGGRGAANLQAVAESENIVALCDVNETNLDGAAQRHPRAAKYRDFRKLFDRANAFDAVVVSTCEHTHAFATLPALQLGKHVYCEKPLTHNVYEARVIRQAAARAKVATQMGTQIHAGDNYRRVVELVETGAVGPVREVHVWVSRAWGWQPSEEEARRQGDIVLVNERPAAAEPVPPWLDWDLWLGPAPERPFNGVYVPGPKWYRWWDFGNGTMSDLGSHWIDLPFWALHLDHPLTVEAQGPAPHAELAPASMQATYEYGPRGELPPVRLTWYQGTNRPTILGEGRIPDWRDGVLFVGDRGLLLADYSKHVLLPEDQFAGFQRPEPYLPPSLGHHQEWLDACKTGAPTTCNFEYAGRLTEANHLGNIAFRIGRKLEWDAEGLRATNAPEAEAYIRREYRKGWSLA
ncbi:MAG TPA: Gfo/Idh/MocA family oxidoreductase [Pirellulales bacterium]|nr:Gfo/Idh/MocA family oxidoreductase [Pirellulales bacterium]